MGRFLAGVLAILTWTSGCGSGGHEGGGPGGRDGGAGTGAGGAGGAAGQAGSGGGAGNGGIEVIQEALSGTRLKAYWYTAADGTKQFAQRWYDSMLKTDCAFQQGPDGSVRCLPQFSFGNVLYGDVTCTTPVAVAIMKNACITTALPWTSISVPDAAACNKYSAKYFNVGPTYTGPAFIASPGSTQPCVENAGTAAIYTSPTYDIYGLGSMLDLGMFQSATLAHD